MGFFALVRGHDPAAPRETARMVSCQRNLMQIGTALALYDQSQGFLPCVPELGSADAAHGGSPLQALLVELGLPDFSALTDTTSRPPRRADLPQRERRVPGFICASDPERDCRDLPRPGQLPGNHGRHPGRPQRRLRPGPAPRASRRSRRPTARAIRPGSPNGSSATTGPNTPRRSITPSRPARSPRRAVPRQRLPPGGATRAPRGSPATGNPPSTTMP